jgi:hypothetical protein
MGGPDTTTGIMPFQKILTPAATRGRLTRERLSLLRSRADIGATLSGRHGMGDPERDPGAFAEVSRMSGCLRCDWNRDWNLDANRDVLAVSFVGRVRRVTVIPGRTTRATLSRSYIRRRERYLEEIGQ